MTENLPFAPKLSNYDDGYIFEITTELLDLLKDYAKQNNVNFDETLSIIIKESLEFINKYQRLVSVSKIDMTIKDYVEGFGCLEIIRRDNIKLDNQNNLLIERTKQLSIENNMLIKKLNELLINK